MANPWTEISLDIYEAHMKQDNVRQLQALNEMMHEQISGFSVSELMILGVAGGNGLEHIDPNCRQRVYGIDINEAYLQAVSKRYSHLSKVLKLLCIDLQTQFHQLPQVEYVIADLLIEYIGIDCFQAVLHHVKPQFVSCIIQIDHEHKWVSDTDYQAAFQGLQQLHQRIDEKQLIESMKELHYSILYEQRRELPNHKELLRLDFRL